MRTSPTQRSTKHLRELGYLVAKVEQRLPIPGKFVTKDCFGWGDLLAVHPTLGIALVQTTSGSNLAARLTKAKGIAGPLIAWLTAGGRLLAHGWAKRGPRGQPKVWTLREVVVDVSMLVSTEEKKGDQNGGSEKPAGSDGGGLAASMRSEAQGV